MYVCPLSLLEFSRTRTLSCRKQTSRGYEKAYLFNNAGLVGPIAYAQVRQSKHPHHGLCIPVRIRDSPRLHTCMRPGIVPQDLARDLAAVRRAVDVNLTSFVYLTARFLDRFGPPPRDLPSSDPPPASSSSSAAAVRTHARARVRVYVRQPCPSRGEAMAVGTHSSPFLLCLPFPVLFPLVSYVLTNLRTK